MSYYLEGPRSGMFKKRNIKNLSPYQVDIEMTKDQGVYSVNIANSFAEVLAAANAMRSIKVRVHTTGEPDDQYVVAQFFGRGRDNEDHDALMFSVMALESTDVKYHFIYWVDGADPQCITKVLETAE